MNTRSNASPHRRRPGGDISIAVPWATFSVDVPLANPADVPLDVPWETYSVDVPLDAPPLIPLETRSVGFFSPAPPAPSVQATSPAPTPTSSVAAAPTPTPSRATVAQPGTGVVALRVTPATASVTIDGATPAPSTGHVVLAAGRHRLRVSAPGYVASEFDVEVDPGSFSDVGTTLAADASANDPSPTTGRGGVRAWQWAAGLLGAAVVVGGGVVLVARRRARGASQQGLEVKPAR